LISYRTPRRRLLHVFSRWRRFTNYATLQRVALEQKIEDFASMYEGYRFNIGNNAGWKQAELDAQNNVGYNNHSPAMHTQVFCDGFTPGYKDGWQSEMTGIPCATFDRPLLPAPLYCTPLSHYDSLTPPAPA
jgi:hypothetical protein